MGAEALYAFVTFVAVAAVTPGPSNAMLAATGAVAGLRRGLPCVLGVGLGMGLMMFLAALGLGALVLEAPRVLAVMKWAGAALLLWLAWKIATASGELDEGRAVGFLEAVAFQWINPKSWLVSTSAAATYFPANPASPLAQALVFGGVFFAVTLPCSLAWLLCGTALRRAARGRFFKVTMGVLLALSVFTLL
ncbi:MAG TPA: LysE family transporter [Burkholderiales bacterium]|nr:LysE family transporter [Burkholderiales bacterium]